MVKKTVVIDMPDDETTEHEEEVAELEQLNKEEGGDLFRVTDEIRSMSGVYVRLNRTYPTTQGQTGYCGEIPVSDYSAEIVKSRYGPGIYRARIFGPGGKYLPGGGRVEIADMPASASHNATDLASLIALMDKRDSERREKSSRLLELAIPGSLTVIAALLGKNSGPDIGTLIAALKPSPGPSLTDLTSALANMKTLTEGSGARDPLDSILKVMEAVKNLSGSGENKEGGETNWLDVVRDLVKEAVPAVKPLLENIAARQQQQQQQQQQQPQQPLQIVSVPMAAPILPRVPEQTAPVQSDVPVQTAPVQSDAPVQIAPVQSEETDMFMIFKPIINENLSRVAGWAKDDRNPQAYAEIFLDELPQMVANYLSPPDALNYLNHEKWFEVVCEWKPELSTYRDWCDEFRHALIEIVTEQIEDAKESKEETKNDA